LRFREAFLRRTDEVQAVLSLIRVMATTPHGSWKGCPHFGMRDYFEFARARPELPQAAIKEVNLALNDLGISGLRVESISRDPQANRDVDTYTVKISSTTEAGKTYTVNA
jgi:hypothetical protein